MFVLIMALVAVMFFANMTAFRAVMKDERGFVHKKLLGIGKSLVGAATGTIGRQLTQFIPGASVFQRGLGIIRGFTGGTRVRQPLTPMTTAPLTISTPRPTPPRTQTARVTVTSQAQKNLGRSLKLDIPDVGAGIDILRRRLGIGNGNGGNGGALVCQPPLVSNDRGTFCEFPGSPAGGVGEALMGRYGAALEPSFMTINKRVCLPGMTLGKDFLCYNKGAINNKERLWPKGTAPLLTGGEMAAIRKADTARGKVARTAKRLGIQPAAARRARPKPHAHAKAATGVVSV